MGKSKIAVTAASGSLGTAIIKRIVHENGNEDVIGIARNPDKAAHLELKSGKGIITGTRISIMLF